ncbi:hypothetical protein AB0K15_46135 [Amycolatopsis sp. NPDC049253]
MSTTSMLYANLLQAHDSHLYGATRSSGELPVPLDNFGLNFDIVAR